MITTILAITTVGMAVLFAAGCSRGHCHRGKNIEKHADRAVNYLARKLDLDESQKQKVNKIKVEMLAKRKSLTTIKNDVFTEAMAQMDSNDFDENKMNALLNEKEQEIVDFRKFLVAKAGEFHAILTPEQRKELMEKVRKHKKRYHDDD